MHQSRRLEDVSRGFPAEMTARHPPQLLVHQRNQAVEGRSVSLPPGQEQTGYVVHGGGVRHQLLRGKGPILRFLS